MIVGSEMRIEKSDVIEAPIERVFNIVADVLNYPAFLPGTKTMKTDRGTYEMTVRIGSVSLTWCSLIDLHPNHSIDYQMVDGPFEYFQGSWRFRSKDSKTIVTHTAEFEFRTTFKCIDGLLARAIEQKTDLILNAFRHQILTAQQGS